MVRKRCAKVLASKLRVRNIIKWYNTIAKLSKTSLKQFLFWEQRDITFINAQLEFCTNIKFSYKWLHTSFTVSRYDQWDHEHGDKINPNEYNGSVYNHFYNGVWQEPVHGTHWVHNGNIYAHATTYECMHLSCSSF